MKRRVLAQVGVLASLLGVWWFSPWGVGVVLGESMTPTLHSGEWLAIDRYYYRNHRPRPGEIVVFRHQGATYVKRVYAGEGETICLVAEGTRGARSLVQPIPTEHEAWVRAAFRRTDRLIVLRLRVPEGSFFAMGDSLSNSIDSRDLGPIESRELLGRVWPLTGGAVMAAPELPPCYPIRSRACRAACPGRHPG
jgi:signal peptidase I